MAGEHTDSYRHAAHNTKCSLQEIPVGPGVTQENETSCRETTVIVVD